MQQSINSQWDALDKNSLMPSASHARLWLAPMFEHFHKNNTHLISADSLSDSCTGSLAGSLTGSLTADNPSLQAITALKQTTLPGGIPLPIAQTWDNGFLFSGTPLISGNDPQGALSGLLSNARKDMGAKAVLFKKVQHADRFAQLLKQLSKDSIAGYQLFNMHQRAALFCGENSGCFDHWFTDNFSRKRAKEYRRLRNRLAETGNLQSQTWQPSQPVENWIEEFLQLEAAGWKGRSGTAVACSDEQSAHLRHALPEMAQKGSLLFWRITLDNKPIASLFGFHQHDQVWLGKMAFDEQLAHFSPGVLVILDASKDLFARKDVTMADSSADPDHPMINNIWRDRIDVADYLIATPGTSKATFKALIAFEKIWLQARQSAKMIYHLLPQGAKK